MTPQVPDLFNPMALSEALIAHPWAIGLGVVRSRTMEGDVESTVGWSSSLHNSESMI